MNELQLDTRGDICHGNRRRPGKRLTDAIQVDRSRLKKFLVIVEERNIDPMRKGPDEDCRCIVPGIPLDRAEGLSFARDCEPLPVVIERLRQFPALRIIGKAAAFAVSCCR